MSRAVIYSDRARRDLRGIYEYIASRLCVPETAKNQTGRIMKEIRSLQEMPLRYRVYEEEPWHSQGLRILPVDNYLVFYLLDEENHTVSVVRIMYGGRDISHQLGNITEQK